MSAKLLLTIIATAVSLLSPSAAADTGTDGESGDCRDSHALRYAAATAAPPGTPLDLLVKTNLLYDAAMVPNIGLEVTLRHDMSLCINGQFAWWSDRSRNFFWRIWGADAEVRWWWTHRAKDINTFTGHHIGIYGAMASYDFETGGNGIRAYNPMGSIGAAYGYSFRITRALNIDVGLRVGYAFGPISKYRPECGEYIRTKDAYIRYFGPTGLEVSLVWFPFSKERR